MINLRFLIETAVAVLVAVVLATIGWFVADLLVTPICASVGIGQVVLSDLSDVTEYRLGIAAAFALPVFVGWLAALIDRVVSRSRPTPSRLAIYVSVPFLAAVLGFAKNVVVLKIAIAEATRQSWGMFSLTELQLGGAPIRWTVASGVLLCVLAGVLARQRAAATRAATS